MANILVSACLIGCDCSYRGDSNYREAVTALTAKHTLIPVCPEQLGGLPTPRVPAEVQPGDGSVLNKEGRDVSDFYRRGAEAALQIAKTAGADTALLKARSPSCGHGIIYDGSFGGTFRPGSGVTAALLDRNNIHVFTEETMEDLLK